MPTEAIPSSLVGATIESEASYRRRLAQTTHAAWFADPGNVSRQHAYAYALRDLGRALNHQGMMDHADSLLMVPQEVP